MKNFCMTLAAFTIILLVILQVSTLLWAYEVKTDALHSEAKGEQERKILKEWIDSVIEDREEDKKKARLLFTTFPGL